MKLKKQMTTLVAIIGLAVPASAADEKSEAGVEQNPTKDAYFGNLHVHTKWSFDGYINGSVSDPDQAYRWAQGEEIPGGGDGTPLKIGVPLDWYCVSDHAEYLGALPLMEDKDSPVSKHPLAAAVTGDDAKASFDAYTTRKHRFASAQSDAVCNHNYVPPQYRISTPNRLLEPCISVAG